MVLIVVAYGMLVSFFRRLGWILCLLVWLALEVGERVYPPLRALNVKALLDVEHHGLTPLLDARAWQLHAAMAAGALVLAARLWLGDASGSRASTSGWASAPACAGWAWCWRCWPRPWSARG